MTLQIRREGAVLVLANDNPARRNALSGEFYAAATAALDDLADNPEIGAVVLTGAGNFFCAGGDLNQLQSRRELAPTIRRERLELLHNLIRRIRDLKKPVIAAVEGGAAGAGVSLALACDLVVAARNAHFSVSYIKVGLSPDGGATAFLAEFAGRQLLTELCLTGEPICAERLHALGTVNRLVDTGHAEAEAITLATRLAEGPARSAARIKALCRQAHTTPLDAQLENEAEAMVESLGDVESAEGIDAFLSKRTPNFTSLRHRGD
ncbi:MAG: enoyl-CoA hydratase [Achromobacter sp.]|nr:enoyl-CoA hydratase [Achromobacter sp.]